MRWALVGADLLLLALGALFLLYGYGVVRRRPVRDGKSGAALGGLPAWPYRVLGWCLLLLAGLGVVGYLLW
jgi:hypothetical protein